MKVSIEGKNIELTKALKDYINEKLQKIDTHYGQIIKGHEVKVKLSVAKNPRISNGNVAEITIFVNGNIVRSEQASQDMYASVDLVIDKIDRQVQKYKEKAFRSYQHQERPQPNPELSNVLLAENTVQGKLIIAGKIIKSKKFQLHPMSPEEAAEQLDMISHDFYVFVNSKTHQINTIYLRKDGDYGLIEPVF